MEKIENLNLTKEMKTGLKEVRELEQSGRVFCTDEIKTPLTILYSENLLEPKMVEINGEKVMSCCITDFGWEVLKHIDDEAK